MIRYTEIELPREPYMPGRGMTHPRRRPPYSHLPELPVVILTPETWSGTIRYLYAADLFNNGYWWEVHEVLEGLWLILDRMAQPAVFLQGLIQTAAAMLKHKVGDSRAAVALLVKAREKISTGPSLYFGLDTVSYLDDLAAYLAGEKLIAPVWRLMGLGEHRSV